MSQDINPDWSNVNANDVEQYVISKCDPCITDEQYSSR